MSLKELLILDLETTGLDGFPSDRIVQFGYLLCQVYENDSNKYELIPSESGEINIFEPEYRDVYKKSYIFVNDYLDYQIWKKGALNFDRSVVQIQKIITNKILCCYNVNFDLAKFLYREPFNVRERAVGRLTDPMIAMTFEARIPRSHGGGFKWPKLSESFDFVTNNPSFVVQKHNALADCLMIKPVIEHLFNNNPKMWYKDFLTEEKINLDFIKGDEKDEF
jgi:hypothetical protein